MKPEKQQAVCVKRFQVLPFKAGQDDENSSNGWFSHIFRFL